MQKLILLPALTLLAMFSVFMLGQQSKSAHAATVTTTASVNKDQPDTVVAGEKQDSAEASTEVKSAEPDGTAGHQDSQGSNVNHQFNGEE